MLDLLFPHDRLESIYEIDYTELKQKGIKLLIFDIDNTLMPFDEPHPPKEVTALIAHLKKMGFKLVLISNNSKKRVELFNRSLNLPAISRALKPLPFKVKRMIKKQNASTKQTAIIGDQVFTDILCGNLLHLTTILTNPISIRDEFTVKLKRGIERAVLNIYERKKRLAKRTNSHYNKTNRNTGGITLCAK